MKLSELKEVAEEGLKLHFMDEFNNTFDPQRVKAMIELLEKAESLISANKLFIEANCTTKEFANKGWLEAYEREFGE